MHYYASWNHFMRYLSELEEQYKRMVRSAESKEARNIREGQASAIKQLREHLSDEQTYLAWRSKADERAIAEIVKSRKFEEGEDGR